MYNAVRIHLDEVEQLGAFMEFEIPVRGSMPEAQSMMDFLIQRFGIDETACFKESYLDLMMEQKRAPEV